MPMWIAAEATNTNGKYILPFRKGAFASLLPVRPVVYRYWSPFYHACIEAMNMFVCIMMACINPYMKMDVYVLPPL